VDLDQVGLGSPISETSSKAAELSQRSTGRAGNRMQAQNRRSAGRDKAIAQRKDWPGNDGVRSDQSSSVTLTVQPMAVTSAPAPAPWMISGRGEYLRVKVSATTTTGELGPMPRPRCTFVLVLVLVCPLPRQTLRSGECSAEAWKADVGADRLR
jgi:hypothetical protein